MQTETTRATIYLDKSLRKALRLKAADSRRSISEIVSDAVRESRGVYVTPEPVVGFIVRGIEHLLKTQFGKPAGLADDARSGHGYCAIVGGSPFLICGMAAG